MTRDEKIKKIMEMSIEIVKLAKTSDKEIDNLYQQTKIMLEIYKKAMEDEENE